MGGWASIKDCFGVGSDGGIKLEKILYIVTLLNQLWRKLAVKGRWGSWGSNVETRHGASGSWGSDSEKLIGCPINPLFDPFAELIK
ncbi:hypothetical protein MC7420_299 [Coleofasciculus chthonoplastes PCC 7420]|uniref:Uncharacterized protein n=1 Tax=Coleofasciculus chthonoplastes PCC 7420 TaxID=118168 RepID=B4VKP7_9CYAN|nr:hypothetical protein MC7420_299 [Coleofasciculus chthonoplastes PCC 7420]